MKIEHISSSYIGKNKKQNEDRIHILDHAAFTLFTLFDGVGSSENNQKAIDIAIEYISNHWQKNYSGQFIDLPKLFFNAHKGIIKNYKNAYTTFCTVFIDKYSGKMEFSSIGDTRLYIITKTTLNQISFDHSSPLKQNILTHCLGLENLDSGDIISNRFSKDWDDLLICTDGFYLMMEKDLPEFHKTFLYKRMAMIQKNLENKVTDNSDDASYILIRKYV